MSSERRAAVIGLGLVISVLSLLLLAGNGPWAGRVLVAVDDAHGLHVGDLPILALWASGTAACVWLVRT